MQDSKVTLTKAEYEALVAKASGGAKPFKITPKEGISTKTGKPYSGFQITGNFPPVYLSRTVLKALAENGPALEAAAA